MQKGNDKQELSKCDTYVVKYEDEDQADDGCGYRGDKGSVADYVCVLHLIQREDQGHTKEDCTNDYGYSH